MRVKKTGCLLVSGRALEQKFPRKSLVFEYAGFNSTENEFSIFEIFERFPIYIIENEIKFVDRLKWVLQRNQKWVTEIVDQNFSLTRDVHRFILL